MDKQAAYVHRELKSIFDEHYQHMDKKELDSITTPHVIKHDEAEYSIPAHAIPDMVKHFGKLATAKVYQPTGAGTGKEHRNKSMQRLYSDCQSKDVKKLNEWVARLTKSINTPSSYGLSMEDYPYLTDKDILTIVEEVRQKRAPNKNITKKRVKIIPTSPEVKAKVEIVYYSEKAIALFGDTKPYKDRLTELGCKFNPFLTKDGKKQPGWIASRRREQEVRTFVESL